MHSITIREPNKQDKVNFMLAINESQSLHHPWVKVPLTSEEFERYIARNLKQTHKSFLVMADDKIAGVYNINEIVRGVFQSAYLGFYATVNFSGKGCMREGLNLVLEKAFNDLSLHRLEANVQPKNNRSINLIKNSGFIKEGYSSNYLKINDAWCDHERWAMTIEDWTKKK